MNKEEEIESLTDTIELQHLNLKDHNTPLVAEILQKVSHISQMKADTAMSQLAMDDLARMIPLTASRNNLYKYEAITKIFMGPEIKNLNKMRKDLDMTESLMLNSVKLILVRKFMSSGGLMNWTGDDSSSISGTATSMIAHRSFSAGHSSGLSAGPSAEGSLSMEIGEGES